MKTELSVVNVIVYRIFETFRKNSLQLVQICLQYSGGGIEKNLNKIKEKVINF